MPEAPIAGLPLDHHLREHGLAPIGIVVDDDDALGGVEPVQSASTLCEDAAPGNRHGQKQDAAPISRPFRPRQRAAG